MDATSFIIADVDGMSIWRAEAQALPDVIPNAVWDLLCYNGRP